MSDTVINTVATGDVFIVPNSLGTLREYSPSTRERIKRDLSRLNINGFRGADVEDDEPLVEIWATSSECDNWTRHNWLGHPFYGGSVNKYQGLCEFWPARALMGVEEGAKFVASMVAHDGREWRMVLTPNQEGYRYRGRGNFQQLLREKLEDFKSRPRSTWPESRVGFR